MRSLHLMVALATLAIGFPVEAANVSAFNSIVGTSISPHPTFPLNVEDQVASTAFIVNTTDPLLLLFDVVTSNPSTYESG